MAALQRALALAEVHDGAVRVGEHLDLDVARALEVALDQHPGVAERRLPSRRAASSAPSSSPAARTARMPLPPPPATALIMSG